MGCRPHAVHHRVHLRGVEPQQRPAPHLQPPGAALAAPRTSSRFDPLQQRGEVLRGRSLLHAGPGEQVDLEVGVVVLARSAVDEVLGELRRRVLPPPAVGALGRVLRARGDDVPHFGLPVLRVAQERVAQQALADGAGGEVLGHVEGEEEPLPPPVLRRFLGLLAGRDDAAELEAVVSERHREAAEVAPPGHLPGEVHVVPRVVLGAAHGARGAAQVPGAGLLVEEVEARLWRASAAVLGEGVEDDGGRGPHRRSRGARAPGHQLLVRRLEGAVVVVHHRLGRLLALAVRALPLQLPQRGLASCGEALQHRLAQQALPDVGRRVHALRGRQRVRGALQQLHRQGLGEEAAERFHLRRGRVRHVRQEVAPLHPLALRPVGLGRRDLRDLRGDARFEEQARRRSVHLFLQGHPQSPQKVRSRRLQGARLVVLLQQPQQPRHQRHRLGLLLHGLAHHRAPQLLRQLRLLAALRGGGPHEEEQLHLAHVHVLVHFGGHLPRSLRVLLLRRSEAALHQKVPASSNLVSTGDAALQAVAHPDDVGHVGASLVPPLEVSGGAPEARHVPLPAARSDRQDQPAKLRV